MYTKNKPALTPKDLEKLANKIRFEIILNSHKSKTPHLGSCLSCTDILVYFYWCILNILPNDPTKIDRDRFILSKGHAAPALFFVLAEKGFFSKDFLNDYGKDGSIFGEHPPTPASLGGIEAATGSLGHGFCMGAGMALASKLSNINYNVYACISDGECNEGTIWEGAMFAANNQLDNFVTIVDYNKWQATERSCNNLGSLRDKWMAFGWSVEEADGNDFNSLKGALEKLNKNKLKKPKIIIAHTIKGKGISFMEDDNNWHYRIPTVEEVEKCAKELDISYSP